jgi:formate dehydrogenase major subunit
VSARGQRENPSNEGRLCVKGRFGFSFVNSPDRLKTPLIRRNGKLEEATWDEALDLVAERFSAARGDAFAAIASAKLTNEENYLIQKFSRAVSAAPWPSEPTRPLRTRSSDCRSCDRSVQAAS